VSRFGLLPLLAVGLVLRHTSAPTALKIEPDARAQLRLLWASSIQARGERVACLASHPDGDTLHVTRVRPLDDDAVDSLAVGAASSLELCGPPDWQGTVHTHIALYDGQRPYSTFSGSDRGVMLAWGQRWRTQGTFCLLFGQVSVHCELDGPEGIFIFPSTTY
jgi:hypothetical protein